MRLEKIGFYTLFDLRAETSSVHSRLMRCEIILSNKCNFKCPYCRRRGEETTIDSVKSIISKWASHGLFAIRFSGGEPTLYDGLEELVAFSKAKNIEKIAISTNGSALLSQYKNLVKLGVNDFSISLDACCSSDGEKMSGGINGSWEIVTSNIRELSKLIYVTVGVVLTKDNESNVSEIIQFAHGLGVHDIRVIPAAQNGNKLNVGAIEESTLNNHPILEYRIGNFKGGVPVRGLDDLDTTKCPLVLDDMCVSGNKHYPCVIYFREGGNEIGDMNGSIEAIRQQRHNWFMNHDTHKDLICSKNCLDVCRDYNNACRTHQDGFNSYLRLFRRRKREAK